MLQSALAETLERLDRRRNNPGAGRVPTGFVDIDEILCGLRDSELGVLAARPSVGKSQLALMIARHAAVFEQMPVLFTALEQSRLELTERLLCCHAGVDGHSMRTGRFRPEETQRIMDGARGNFGRANLVR